MSRTSPFTGLAYDAHSATTRASKSVNTPPKLYPKSTSSVMTSSLTARNRGMSAEGIAAADAASVTADTRAIALSDADKPASTTSSPRPGGTESGGANAMGLIDSLARLGSAPASYDTTAKLCVGWRYSTLPAISHGNAAKETRMSQDAMGTVFLSTTTSPRPVLGSWWITAPEPSNDREYTPSASATVAMSTWTMHRLGSTALATPSARVPFDPLVDPASTTGTSAGASSSSSFPSSSPSLESPAFLRFLASGSFVSSGIVRRVRSHRPVHQLRW
mmetsp:Transcript_7794/g.32087  ORF Transcript_7794/g.32087 Transcript_7794/m.32087 type:complete len:276 (-) Transcript_7794:514-1341(-)